MDLSCGHYRAHINLDKRCQFFSLQTSSSSPYDICWQLQMWMRSVIYFFIHECICVYLGDLGVQFNGRAFDCRSRGLQVQIPPVLYLTLDESIY